MSDAVDQVYESYERHLAHHQRSPRVCLLPESTKQALCRATGAAADVPAHVMGIPARPAGEFVRFGGVWTHIPSRMSDGDVWIIPDVPNP